MMPSQVGYDNDLASNRLLSESTTATEERGTSSALRRERTRRRRPGIIVVATAIALASTASGPIRATLAFQGQGLSVEPQSVVIQSNSRATTVHVYAPFRRGKLAPGLVVRKRAAGSCWTGSLATGRRDAWRCS